MTPKIPTPGPALARRTAGIIAVRVTVANPAIRTMNKEFSTLPLRDRACSINRAALGGRESGDSLGAFTSPSPLIAVFHDVDVFRISHNLV